jgi:hypothetical protein
MKYQNVAKPYELEAVKGYSANWSNNYDQNAEVHIVLSKLKYGELKYFYGSLPI